MRLVEAFIKQIKNNSNMDIAINTSQSRYHVNDKGYYGEFGAHIFPKCSIPTWRNCGRTI